MQITFWGVRGSFPAPGHFTWRYGGNTPCVEVQAGDARVIVDAGTGIHRLGRSLPAEPGSYCLVFSHIHWDHIQGLSFFAPLRHPDTHLTIYTPSRCLRLLQELLSDGGRQVFLPNPPGRLPAHIEYQTFQAGDRWSIGTVEISTVELNHPCHSVGFRFSAADRSAVYFSDTAPFDDILFGSEYLGRAPQPGEKPSPAGRRRLAKMRQAAIELSRAADLLIYDAHFSETEYPAFAHFGHSTPRHALEMAQQAGARELVLFHHAPGRADAEVAEIEARYRTLAGERGMALRAAREGERITL